MSRNALAAVTLLLLTGCASLTHEPGTPNGGPYCTQRGGDPEPACYPTEEERATAWRRREAEARAAWLAEHPEEVQAREAERAAREARQAQQHAYIEEQQRQRAEQEATWARNKEAAEQAKAAAAARAAELQQLASDPAVATRAISAIMCTISTELEQRRLDLDRAKRASALAGVPDRRNLTYIASDIVEGQDELVGWRASLKRYGARGPLPCPSVAAIVACRNLRPERCDPAALDAAEVWHHHHRELWGSSRPRRVR